MRYLIRFAQLVVLALLVAVTVQNSHSVEFKLLLGQVWQAPLIIFLLLFFVLGTLVGLSGTLVYYLCMRRELSQLKKELRARPSVVRDPSDALAD